LKAVLRGVIAFAPTPFTDGDRVDLDELATTVRELGQSGAPVAVCGAVGEYTSLDLDEYRTVIRTATDAASGRFPVIVGIGHGTRIAAGLASDAAHAGAAGLLINPFTFTDPSEHGLVDHYRTIGAAAGLGMVVFSTRGHVCSLSQLLRLVELDAVAGLKDEWGDLRAFGEARERIGGRLAWINGMAEMQAAEYAALGADSMTSGLVNIAPDLAMCVWDAATDNRWDELRGYLARIRPFAALRARRPGYSVAVIKEAMAMLGRGTGAVRPPLSPLSPDDRAELRSLLPTLGREPVS
jgi:5-dehydro-4-deoxyglucarate dehydratase